jgi:large subunit ribosomal protein L10
MNSPFWWLRVFLSCNSDKSRRFIVALNLDDKKAIVAEVNETAAQALSLVIADARGVDVTDMTALRAKARAENVQLRVVRNTLAKRAFADTDYACVDDVLVGPSLFAFSMEDPGAAARLFKDFAKENEEFEVKALSVGGQLLASEQIDVLAKLPTLEQALGMLAGVTLAPVTKLVRTFNEIPTKTARVVSAVRDAKQEAA